MSVTFRPTFDRLQYGGDYNPEQWPEEVWAEDVELMREAGVNLVTVGVFSWALLEPHPGQFEFAWLDRVLDLLHDAGIGVDLATATASPPVWLAAQHPESLPVDERGTRMAFGSRQQYAPTSLDYRFYATRLVRKMAERYGSHPAVVMWHVNNEYGCHTSLDYSPSATAAFRVWLRDLYVTVDRLNHAWGTAFWSQRYTSFDQITAPSVAPTWRNPTQLVDFRRFSSDALLECYKAEVEILREVTPDIPVTTNFIGAFKPVDYWRWAPHLDIVSVDSYPDPSDPEVAMRSAMTFDLTRSLGGGKPWLLMEQATGHVQWRSANATKRAGQMRALSHQAVARGADGVLFFQWRQSRAGAEQFHTAMVPHAGTRSRTWREVVQLGRELDRLRAVAGSENARARVAIVFDWDSWWAVEGGTQPRTDDYVAAIETWYRPLHEANVAVDFVRPFGDLSDYDLVIAQHLLVLSREDAAALARYAEDGGTLLVGHSTGVVDEHLHAYLDGYLGPLRPAVGVRVEEFAPLPDAPHPNAAIGVRSDLVGDFQGLLWGEIVEATSAKTVATFTDADLAGMPAITRNDHGRGSAWYVATTPEPDGARRIIDRVLDDAGVPRERIALPVGVEAVRRGGFLILTNQTDGEVSTGVVGEDLLGGAVDPDGARLPPYGTLVVRVGK